MKLTCNQCQAEEANPTPIDTDAPNGMCRVECDYCGCSGPVRYGEGEAKGAWINMQNLISMGRTHAYCD